MKEDNPIRGNPARTHPANTRRSNAKLRPLCLLLGLLMMAWMPLRIRGQSPPNDLFANALALTGSSGSVSGSNAGATLEPGEPELWPYIGGASVWYIWTAPTTALTTFDTLGSSFDTLLAIYHGAFTNLFAVGRSDDMGGSTASQTQFLAMQGQTYMISVDGILGATGDYALSFWQGDLPPRYFREPQSTSVPIGSTVTFTSSQSPGQNPWSFQWLKEGVAISGATDSSYSITNVTMSDAGDYSVFLSNWVGTATSSNAALTVEPLVIDSRPQKVIVAAGYGAWLDVQAAGPAPITYQWSKNESEIPGATNSTYSLRSATALDAGTYTVSVTDALTNAVSTDAVVEVIAPYTFATLAGKAGSAGSTDGRGPAARFNSPHGIAVDNLGYVYVTEVGNSTVRKITPGGTVTTLAGQAGSAGSADGPGTTARFNGPWGIAVDGVGNLVIADTGNHTIREIKTDGSVTTLAGQAGQAGYADGAASGARFDNPADVAIDTKGNLYIADHDNDCIRVLTLARTVSIVAGLGFSRPMQATDGPAPKARFYRPCGLGFDRDGNLYIADEYNSLVRRLSPDQGVSTVAGYPDAMGSADGTGSAARFNFPHGAKADMAGNVYIADYKNCTIRRVTPGGVVTTLAGMPGQAGTADGTGIAARFSQVRDIAVDRWGNLYVTDFDNQTVRKGWASDASLPPEVTVQPQSQTVANGAGLLLCVAAGRTGMLSFQWRLNGSALPGETNDVLQVAQANQTNAGVYSVLVSNQFGSVASSNAVVQVVVPLEMQAPQCLANGTVRLLLRNSDGTLPRDASALAVQWRNTLPGRTDTNWAWLGSSLFSTNGFLEIDDTNAPGQRMRFYRALQQ